MSKQLIVYDRSRVTTDWQCPRRRFWNYEYAGRGIVPNHTHLELYLGTAVHDGLTAIARGLPIDDIATAGQIQVQTALEAEGDQSPEAGTFAKEQAALVEGQLRGFHKYVWPKLQLAYPKILWIEEEMVYRHDGLTFMARPDLVVEDTNGDVWHIEYKTTSSKQDSWINSWDTAVQLHSSIRAVEQTKKVKVAGVIVQGLYKGYCLEPSTPILTTDLQWKPVGDLKQGDRIAGFEEIAGNNRSGGNALRNWKEATVTNTGRQTLPCYQITLEDGTKFVCSENHKWLTAYEAQGTGSAAWKTTEDLKAGVSRVVKLINPWEGTGEIDPYDAGYLAAAFDGEGCLSSPKTDIQGKEYFSLGLQFTQNPNQMLDHMKMLMDRYGITWSGNDREGERNTESLQLYGKIKVLSLLGKIRPKRLLPKLNFDKLGMIKDLPTRPVKVISKIFVGNREVVALETSTGTLVANGFASHNSSYGKQNSPFCYGYKKSGNPPFSQDQHLYEYKYGFHRSPTWELPGGVAAWVGGMPDAILADQFPQTPPIFVNDSLLDSFFAQRNVREREIQMAVEMLDLIDQNPEDEGSKPSVLNTAFPQRFDMCKPSYGKGCPYAVLCHSSIDDPLQHGFSERVPHHELEKSLQ